MENTLDKIDLQKEADKLLLKNGFQTTGDKKKRICKAQRFFEKRILITPMGHKR
ncbi:hypothetical protein IPJ63_01655 [Candidatus Nomurabacteria bacterium]|nr:MAG: hypothetical protein IPJ63_01655 [Candidatus Nomurabacteria bacterium]